MAPTNTASNCSPVACRPISVWAGVLAFGVAMGALFAVAYCVAYGRVGDISPRRLSVLLAGGMLLSLYVIPALKYPPNPPAVSLDETIRQRTLLYLLMVVLSAALIVAAVWLGRRLAPKFGGWSATLIAAGSYVVAVAVVMLVLPTIDETPGPVRDDAGTIIYPASPPMTCMIGCTHWYQLVLWATIGLVFAPMAARLLGDRKAGGWRAFRRNEVVRLTLVSHAMTDAMAAGRFPTDEPLNSVGHRQVDASIDLGIADSAYCGPEKRSRQTAELLGLQAAIEPPAGRSGLRQVAGRRARWCAPGRPGGLANRSRPGRRTAANPSST